MTGGTKTKAPKTQKRVFDFDILCCAACALSIEYEAEKIDGILSAKVDCDTQTLSVELAPGKNNESVTQRLSDIAARFDSALAGGKKSAATTKRLYLQGLDCADCARKIEDGVKKIDGVDKAVLDFVIGQLTITVKDKKRLPGILNEAEKVAHSVEPDIAVSRHAAAEGSECTEILLLDGLDCADCAHKIESRVKAIEGVSSASLDFASQRLKITVYDKKHLYAIIKEAEKIALEIEPDVKISPADKKFAHNTGNKTGRPHILEGLRSHYTLVLGALLFAIGVIFNFPWQIELALFLSSLILTGGEVFLRSAKNLMRGRVFDENFLMSIATAGAFALGDFPEGAAVMLFYQVGELLQDIAVSRSRKSISALMNIRPDYANVKSGDEILRVSPEEVSVGDIIVVRPGEKIPLDGVVIEGLSTLDTSSLTGESLPRDVGEGSEVLSGSVNISGLLTISVKKPYAESTVARILDLVQNASSQKAPTENFITKFARYYTPVVVFSALALAVIPPLVIPGALFSDWLHRALIFLVVSCPCALVVSIPLGFFGGIGGASRRGILIKGSNYLEALNSVSTVVFDKTGTLTLGRFKVTAINPAAGFSKDELLELSAHAETHSVHPIAQSIRAAYGSEPDLRRVKAYEEIAGNGVSAIIDGRAVLAGNAALMKRSNISFEKPGEPGTVVYVAVDGIFAGSLVISDETRPDSKAAVSALKAAGVRRTIMLTGDGKDAGERVARELGIDGVYTELLPQDKVFKLEEIIAENPGGHVAFVGDGINDAPVLARADIGVAMGGLGSDAAIEAADVVLMTDEPSKLVEAIEIAKKTRRVVWENIAFALGVKIVIMILGAFGVATMWEAVFGDVGVALIAVVNSTRTMRK